MKTFRQFAAVAALMMAGLAPAAAQTVTVSFVQANDTWRIEEADGRGGFARLASVVNAERARGTTVFVHAGDTLSPSFLSGIDHGAHIIDLMNLMGVDFFVPGNQEFDFGADIFRQRMSEANFTVLSANLLEADGTVPANVLQEAWLDIEGVRIALYGLTTEEAAVISSPGTLRFENAVATGVAKAAELRAAGADIVIALVHTPLDVDMALFRTGAADLILSGHDEHLMTYYNGTVSLTESAAQAEMVVVTRLLIEVTEIDGARTVNWRPDFDIVDTATVVPDPEVGTTVAAYLDQLGAELNVPIGTATVALDSRWDSVVSGEATMGNLITDAMRATVGADIAIINGGAIRGNRIYAPGTEMTRRHILAELPFNNRTLKLEVTGAQILAALENGFSEIKFGTGRFPQVSGLVVEVNSFAAPGNRVLSVTIAGQPLVQSALYTLATNDFMAGGGDGYTILRNAPRLIDMASATLTTSDVIAYIEAVGPIPADGPRIVLY